MSNTSHRSSGAPSLTSPTTSPNARQQPSQAERTADARKAFLNSLGVASSEVDAELKSRAKTIHANQEAVAKQDTGLQRQTKQLAKEYVETERWLSKSKQKLAEYDEWANISDDLEEDLDDLEAMLDLLEQQESQGKASSSSKPV